MGFSIAGIQVNSFGMLLQVYLINYTSMISLL